MSGADQREIHRMGLAAAQRRDFALLQRAQQPRLHRRRHVAHLVQEQHAAVGLAQLAGHALAPRAGEAPSS